MSSMVGLASSLMPAVDWLVATQLKAAVIFGLALVVAECLRSRSAAARRGVWALALAAALLLPLASALLPRVEVAALPTLHGILPLVPGPDIAGHGAVAKLTSGASAPSSSAALPIVVASSVGIVWALGFLLLGARHLRALVHARVLVSASRPMPAPAWAASSNTAMDLGSRLRTLPRISGPMTAGLRRPVILVPESFPAWTSSRQRSVVLHELAHVVRNDCLFLTLGATARAFFWVNPLAWIALRRLLIEAEHAADDAVLAGGVRPSDYASHLLALARAPQQGLTVAALPIAGRSLLGQRVRAILSTNCMRSPRQVRRLAPIGLATLGAVLTFAAIDGPRDAGIGEASEQREPMLVVLDANGRLEVGDEAVDLRGLERLVCAYAEAGTDRAVHVRTTPSTDQRELVNVMDIAKRCGVRRLGILHPT